jgi:hypothetical protein
MENTGNIETFQAQVDSIQSRFLESLITGRRTPIFGRKVAKPESEDEARQVYIDSQRETF